MGNLTDQAKKDIAQITSNLSEFGIEMMLTAPGGETATIVGLHTKHHLGVDAQINKLVNTKNAHCSFSEQFLVDQNYPLRNDAGIVDLAKHRVTVKDSTGNACTYVIGTNFPDETVGLICCILEDWIPE